MILKPRMNANEREFLFTPSVAEFDELFARSYEVTEKYALAAKSFLILLLQNINGPSAIRSTLRNFVTSRYFYYSRSFAFIRGSLFYGAIQ